MIIFPAVDIQGGKAVRLKKGRFDDSTIFSPDPVQAALHWQTLGAKWLHLVDLDGAFAGKAVNLALISKMCETLSIPIQMGGGIRDKKIAQMYLSSGVKRLIIGTMALEQPDVFADLCHAFPGCIGVSLDTEQGRIKTKGWVADSGKTLNEVLPTLHDQGAAFLIHTDIDRDGMQTGVNLPLLQELANQSKVPLIAAGGVATLADIKQLYPLTLSGNLQGVITGRAIYEGTLDFAAAMQWIGEQKHA